MISKKNYPPLQVDQLQPEFQLIQDIVLHSRLSCELLENEEKNKKDNWKRFMNNARKNKNNDFRISIFLNTALQPLPFEFQEQFMLAIFFWDKISPIGEN